MYLVYPYGYFGQHSALAEMVCADPERFVRGGPTLTTVIFIFILFILFFLVYKGRDDLTPLYKRAINGTPAKRRLN